MSPLNERAQAVGSPKLDFFRGLPGGPMKVTMPDGEVLPGTYQISEGLGSSTPADDANFRVTARGPRTSVTCSARLVGGHGTGECRAQDGARYRLDL